MITYRDRDPECLTTGWSRVQSYANHVTLDAHVIDQAIEDAALNLKRRDERFGLSFGEPLVWIHVVSPTTMRVMYGATVEELDGAWVQGLAFPNARLLLVSLPRPWLIGHEIGHHLAYWRLGIDAEDPQSEMWARYAAAGLA